MYTTFGRVACISPPWNNDQALLTRTRHLAAWKRGRGIIKSLLSALKQRTSVANTDEASLRLKTRTRHNKIIQRSPPWNNEQALLTRTSQSPGTTNNTIHNLTSKQIASLNLNSEKHGYQQNYVIIIGDKAANLIKFCLGENKRRK